MPYVDYDYYSNTYGGTLLTEDNFSIYEQAAEHVIDAVTRYFVRNNGIDTLPPPVLYMFQTAVCAQCDYLFEVGQNAASSGVLGADFTVGKVHVGAGALSNLSRGQTMVAAGAIAALEQSGLLDRRVTTLREPYVPFPLGRWQ